MSRTLWHLVASIVFGVYCALIVSSFPTASATHVLFTLVGITCASFITLNVLRGMAARIHSITELKPAQENIEIRACDRSIGDKAKRRIKFRMSSRPGSDTVEDIINRINREHGVALAARLTGIALVYLGVMVLLIRSMLASSNSPDASSIPFGVPMFVTLVAAFVFVDVWVKWESHYSVLTDQRWYNMKLWPTWLPFKDSSPSAPISRLEITDIEQGGLGKLFGYGTFKTDTGSDQDKKIQIFRAMPKVIEFVGFVNSLQPRR